MLSVHTCLAITAVVCFAAVQLEACPPLITAGIVKLRRKTKDTVEPRNPFKGCFVDVRQVPDMGELRLEDQDMDPDMCLDECERIPSKFMGLQNGTKCFCANRFGNYGESSNLKCNINCPGNINATCGGLDHNSVYEVILMSRRR